MVTLSRDDIESISKAQEKFESESGGGRGRYFMLTPDNIKDGVDITFMTDIQKIEYGSERMDGSVYPDPTKEGQGLDNAGGKHHIFQCDLYVVGGWDTFADSPYDQNAYMSFWFTKEPNNIRYPGIASLLKACDRDNVDIAKIKGTKWHIETRSRPGSSWFDIEWAYLGRDDEGVLLDNDVNKTLKIINEVTNNGESTCAKPSLIIRMDKDGVNTTTRQDNALNKLVADKKIAIEENTVSLL